MTSASQSVPAKADGRTGSAPKKAGLILATLILGAIVANINTSISNVALPSIGRALDATDTELTAITDAYQLGIAATVLYLGAVGDRYGRRKLLLIGSFLCVPFSLLSAYAQTPQVLIAAQICVGIAGAMLYPTTLSLITSLWSGSRLTAAIALWTGVGLGTSILGPIFGGWLLDRVWWGSVFLITVPFAVAVLILGFIVLPKSAGETTDRVDNSGGVLSVVMIGSFVMAIVLLPQGLRISVWIMFAVALVSGVAFVLRERRASNPLFDLKAASIPTFWVAFVAGLIAFGALVGAMFIGQQFTQNVLGQEAFDAVLLTLGLAVGLMPASVVGGRMIEKQGTKPTFILGLLVVALGFVVMLEFWKPAASLGWVVLAYLLVGIGIGLASTSASRSLSKSLPVSKAGMSSASADLTKDLGGAVFQALLGTLLAITYSSYFSAAFATLPPDQAQALGERAAREIGSSYEGAQAVAATLPSADATELMNAAARAFTEGKSAAIITALASVLIGAALVWWKYPRDAQERALFAQIRSQDTDLAS
ncbi:MAG: MFS transporter [Actinomycetes bacterium]